MTIAPARPRPSAPESPVDRLAPDDYRHGRTIGYSSGCRCDRCVNQHRRRCKSYHVRALANGGRTTVDATAAREVLTDLAQTMSLSAIARGLGVTSHNWVSSVIRGDIATISPEREQAVLRIANYRPGDTSHVNALGTRRRIQALHAMGYTWVRLAEEIGCGLTTVKSVAYGKWDVVEAHRAEAVRAAFDRLSVVLPEGADKFERGAINSARNSARKKGWPVPFAWNNPDDPDEQPADWQRATDDWIAELYDLDEHQIGVSEVCFRLDISRKSLQKRCERHDLMHLYSRMVAREATRYWSNGHAEGGVA